MRKNLLFIFMLVAMAAAARDFTYQGIPYTVYDEMAKTCMVRPVIRGVNPNSFSGKVVLPSTVYDGETAYTLVKIGLSAFQNSGVTEVEIPSTVTYIDNYAFASCSGLTKIVIPDGVEYIQANTFRSCSSLAEVVLPKGLKGIRSFAFVLCSSLGAIELPETLEVLEYGAFQNCSNLSTINFPSGITKIPENCFVNCGFYEVNVPANIKKIGEGAFRNCSQLKYVTISDVMESIGSRAFEGCSISRFTCNSVNAPKIGYNVFSSDTHDNGILVIPEGSEISYITGGWISDRESSQGFSFAWSNTNVNININYTYGSTLRYIVDEAAKTAFVAPAPSGGTYGETSIDIPETVNGYKVIGIGASAFMNDKIIKSVTMPQTVTSIGSCAFVNSSVESVSIPSNVTIFGDVVFYKANQLKSVKLPDLITEIPNRLFASSGITSIEIPAGVKRIGDFAFDCCYSLESMTLHDGVESIGTYAMDELNALTSLELPQSVKYIGHAGISWNSKMTSVNIPDGLKEISYYAFGDIGGVRELTIPSSVEVIGFQGTFTPGLRDKVYIGDGIKEICQNGITAENIYISAQEPPMTNGVMVLFSDYIPNVTVYVQGEEALKRYKSVYPWYLFNVVNMVEATEIKTSIESVEGKAGESFKPEVTFVPEDASMQQVIWTSTNPRVATVDSNGVITITEPGSDVPGSRAADYPAENSCKIIATTLYHDGPVAEIQVTNTSIVLGVEDVAADAVVPAVPNHIFNLQGICIKKNATDADVRALTPGLYIIGGKKVMVR